MGRGRQAKDQQPCRDIAEGRHGPTPIFGIEISAPFRDGNFLAVLDQARTLFAADDLVIQGTKVLYSTFPNTKRFDFEHSNRSQFWLKNTRENTIMMLVGGAVAQDNPWHFKEFN